MSYLFDGVDDVISTAAVTLGAQVSVIAWIKPASFGENQSGAIWQQGTTVDTPRFGLRVADNKLGVTSSGWQFNAERATTGSRFISLPNTITLNVWTWLGATYDATSTANDAVLYLNGAVVSQGTKVAGSGAQVADAQAVYLGNNGTGVRTFDGQIGAVAVWTRVLSADEMRRVYWDGPLAAVRGIAHWYTWAQASGGADFAGLNVTGTLSGPVYQTEMPPRLSLGAA